MTSYRNFTHTRRPYVAWLLVGSSLGSSIALTNLSAITRSRAARRTRAAPDSNLVVAPTWTVLAQLSAPVTPRNQSHTDIHTYIHTYM